MRLVCAILLTAAAALVTAASPAAHGQPPPAGPPTIAVKTWSDADLDRLMKQVGATFGAVRKALEAQNADALRENAARLDDLFEEVDDFWAARNVKDALAWADDAAENAGRLEDAAEVKDFAKVTEVAKTLQGLCTSCHEKYRVKAPDGGFRIKP